MRGCGEDDLVVTDVGDGTPLSVGIEIRGTQATCTLQGELDIATASQLAHELDRVLASGVTTIVLDLNHVTFFGVEGLNLLQGLRRRLGHENGLTLHRAAPLVQRMLDVCGMGDLAEPARLG